jgi:hypothetical protein
MERFNEAGGEQEDFQDACMTLLWNEQCRKRFTMCVVICLNLSGVLTAGASQSVAGGVDGTVRVIVGDQAVPVAGARVEARNVSNEYDEYEAATDKAGRYTMDLPPGTYGMRLAWMGGECSIVRRASFGLSASERLAFDFFVMRCPIIDRAMKIPLEEQEAKESPRSQNANSMEVPFAKQAEKYQEQVIPPERHRWPEIIVSFGKYDNQIDEILYFPLHQLGSKHPPIPPAPGTLSLPVTVTVDRYTLRASNVVLDKKTMVITAKGEVSVSDGKHNSTGTSATLSFPAGLPKLEIKR